MTNFKTKTSNFQGNPKIMPGRYKASKMRIYNLKFKNLVLIVSISYLVFSVFYLVDAQTSPQFLISWQAQNYAPSWYQGKILAINGTPIEISFELIDNAKIADLSKTKVRWYVNDKLIKNENDGLGIKSLKIITSDYAGQETEIRIAVVDYKGGETLDEIVTIPVVNPEAVINAPYPDRKIGTGTSIFQVIPFFFNAKNLIGLSVDWSANEQKTEGLTGNPYLLNLNIGPETPKGTEIKVSALVKNLLNQLEFASKSIQLQIK